MNKPGLFWCLAFACVAAVGVRMALDGLWPWLGEGATLRLLTAGLALSYVGFLLAMASVKSGRIVMAAFAALASATMALGPFSFSTMILVLGLVIWLVRVTCFHRGPVAAALDGGLALAGLVAATAAFASTRSVAVAVWVALLTQCLFIYIPGRGAAAKSSAASRSTARFDRAYRAADAALRDLAGRRSRVAR